MKKPRRLKALLTGSEGFIGRWVHDMLCDEGYVVVGVDALEPEVHGDHPRPQRTTLCKNVSQLSVEDFDDVDLIVHLAAQVSVVDSMMRPEKYIIDNTLHTAIMLDRLEEAIRHDWCGPTRIVVASSSSVYGDVPIPMHEDGPTVPTNVYGLTKYDQERLVLSLAPTMDVEAVALRLFNVYGPGQALHNPLTGVLSNFARQILQQEPVTVYDDGAQVRDFVYVEDVAEAITDIATALCLDHEVYNVCTGTPTRMRDVVIKLGDALGVAVEPIIANAHRPGDQRDVVGRNTRLCRERDWYPRPLEAGLDAYATFLSTVVL